MQLKHFPMSLRSFALWGLFRRPFSSIPARRLLSSSCVSAPASVNITTGCLGVNRIVDILEKYRSCSCLRSKTMREGTRADIAVWCAAKGGDSHAIGVQIKACAKPRPTQESGGRTVKCKFSHVQKYGGMLVLCVRLDIDRIWAFDGNTLSALKRDLTLTEGGKWEGESLCSVDAQTVPKQLSEFLCQCVNGRTDSNSKYTRQHTGVWDTPQTLQQQTEMKGEILIKPLLDACGIRVEQPLIQQTAVDQIWHFERACGLQSSVTVQNKTSCWAGKDRGGRVLLRKNAGMEKGKRRHQPYVFGDFDLLCVLPPCNTHAHPHMAKFIEQSGQSFSKYILLTHKHELLERGYLQDPLQGKNGRHNITVHYPGIFRSHQSRPSKVNAWTAERLLNLEDMGECVERVRAVLADFVRFR
eukprot:GDKI01001571.1.p1 GENE.GDKI01001571.1~~GDKI01001571.1.p1  ORF type:complete len:421 (+),score=28.10 GDKI01001571.1:27-1265(+)